jgi:hypothetical protein
MRMPPIVRACSGEAVLLLYPFGKMCQCRRDVVLGDRCNGADHDLGCCALIESAAEKQLAAEQRRLGFSALAGQLAEVNRVHSRLITRPEQAGGHPARRERLLVDPPANRTGSFCSAPGEYASATPGIRLS